MSSDKNRTLMSAMSQLQGLYVRNEGEKIGKNVKTSLYRPPIETSVGVIKGEEVLPGGVQVVPVHSRDGQRDYVLRIHDPDVCPVMKRLLDERKLSGHYLWMEKQMEKAYQFVEKTFKIDIRNKDLLEFNDLFTQKYIMEYQGDEYPYAFPGTPIYKQLQFLYNWAPAYMNTGSHLQTALRISNLLSEIVSYMQKKINNDDSNIPKLLMYSGHDDNILPLMKAMGLLSAECYERVYFNHTLSRKPQYCFPFPLFASNIQIELHEIKDQYFVQVIYNNNVVQLCPPNDYCTFEQFLKFQQKYYIDDILKVCKDEKTLQKVKKSADIGLYIMLGIITCLLIATIILSFKINNSLKKRKLILEKIQQLKDSKIFNSIESV